MTIRPFSDGDLHPRLEGHLKAALDEISELDTDYVLKASATELEQHFVEQAGVTPLVLHTDDYYIEDRSGTRVDVSHDPRRFFVPGDRAEVPGTRLRIAIPYEGDRMLWRLRPSTYSASSWPQIDARDDRIILTVTFPDDSVDPAGLKRRIDSEIESLQKAVGTIQSDVARHNESIPTRIVSAIERRRQTAQATAKTVAGLGIPIKRRNEALTYTIPTKRRTAKIQRPAVPKEKYSAEPVLSNDDYEHILKVLQDVSLVIERNPNSFSSLNEETIRDHFLIQLNGHFEGSATGETFNASGKTDILIRVDGRNVFIAECKFWRGQKDFSEAIDQLLSYLSWRDSKCALFIFNKNKDSTAVREKMHEVMSSRAEHRKTNKHDPEDDSRYIFVKPDDPGREITITTLIFDVPSSS